MDYVFYEVECEDALLGRAFFLVSGADNLQCAVRRTMDYVNAFRMEGYKILDEYEFYTTYNIFAMSDGSITLSCYDFRVEVVP